MCNSGIKQQYAVLKAFHRAGDFIHLDELESEVTRVLSKIGLTEIEELGPQVLESVVGDLYIGDATVTDEKLRQKITESGIDHMLILEGFVEASTPDLVQQ